MVKLTQWRSDRLNSETGGRHWGTQRPIVKVEQWVYHLVLGGVEHNQRRSRKIKSQVRMSGWQWGHQQRRIRHEERWVGWFRIQNSLRMERGCERSCYIHVGLLLGQGPVLSQCWHINRHPKKACWSRQEWKGLQMWSSDLGEKCGVQVPATQSL